MQKPVAPAESGMLDKPTAAETSVEGKTAVAETSVEGKTAVDTVAGIGFVACSKMVPSALGNIAEPVVHNDSKWDEVHNENHTGLPQRNQMPSLKRQRQ